VLLLVNGSTFVGVAPPPAMVAVVNAVTRPLASILTTGTVVAPPTAVCAVVMVASVVAGDPAVLITSPVSANI
jgi:hypothetical protein